MAGTPHPHFSADQLAGQRIALFSGAYDYIADGVTLTLNRLVAYLEDHGAEVLIFAPTMKRPPVLEHAGTLVSVPSMPAPGRPDYRLAFGLTRKLRARLDAFAPHLVHVATPDILGSSALKYAEKRGIPAVASFHTHFGAYLKYFVSYHKYYGLDRLDALAWRFGRWFYGRCRHIYVPTPEMGEELQEKGVGRPDALRLWPRGVETEVFNPRWRDYAWRRALGFADDDVVVAYVSRLVWEKGVRVFADVIEGLTQRGIAHRSLMVGDGPVRSALVKRLPETVFTGHLEGEHLTRAYASADLFLFPSETETFGNVTLEAMASGLPTVCADATGSRSLVDHGTTGLLAPPGDSAAFLEAVARLVTDTEARKAMGRNALERAQTYQWDEVMARIAGYYAEILLPAPAPQPQQGTRNGTADQADHSIASVPDAS